MLLLRHLDRWARQSQQVARRNAMLAATDAVRRRVEREDAESVVAAHAAAYAARQHVARSEAAVTSRTG